MAKTLLKNANDRYLFLFGMPVETAYSAHDSFLRYRSVISSRFCILNGLVM